MRVLERVYGKKWPDERTAPHFTEAGQWSIKTSSTSVGSNLTHRSPILTLGIRLAEARRWIVRTLTAKYLANSDLVMYFLSVLVVQLGDMEGLLVKVLYLIEADRLVTARLEPLKKPLRRQPMSQSKTNRRTGSRRRTPFPAGHRRPSKDTEGHRRPGELDEGLDVDLVVVDGMHRSSIGPGLWTRLGTVDPAGRWEHLPRLSRVSFVHEIVDHSWLVQVDG